MASSVIEADRRDAATESRARSRTARRENASPPPASPAPAAPPAPGRAQDFQEAPVWRSIGEGWRPLFGSFRDLGFSFEWHDFLPAQPFDWGRSFHPGGVELCLNLEGTGSFQDGERHLALRSEAWVFYRQGQPPLTAQRRAGVRHRFITVEYAADFLREHFASQVRHLHPVVRTVVEGKEDGSQCSTVEPIGAALRPLVESLRHCPVFNPAQETWFRSKALELAAHLLFRPEHGELFCTRAQRAGRERVEQARSILRERLQEPPSLEELGRLVGCSPFHLSRLFSQETGLTIQHYLRKIRLERAAELLRGGHCNVTEAALEVGYNSLSHFSTAFREMFQCCPGLYPLQAARHRPTVTDHPSPE